MKSRKSNIIMKESRSHPLITCIIPTYRRPKKLRRAIYSVLNQTYRNILVCVYDNASGDETADVVAEIMKHDPRVRYHCHEKNIGAVRNFQFGQKHVKTEFFSFLSDDDVLLPEFYEMALHALSQRNDLIFAATQVITMTEKGTIVGRRPDHFPPGLYEPPGGFDAMVKYGHPIWTGILFRSVCLKKAGPIDPCVGSPSDLEFELRLAANFPYVVLNKPGAIFVADEGASATGAYAVKTPEGRLKMYHKIIQEYPISEESKKNAVDVLRKRHKKALIGYGLRMIANGDVKGVASVAKVMSLYGRNAIYFFFYSIEKIYKIGILRKIISKIVWLVMSERHKKTDHASSQFQEYERYLRIP